MIRDIIDFKTKFSGKEHFKKLVKAGNRYYWQLYLPGFPSEAFDNHMLGLLNRFTPVNSFHNQLAVLFLGLTDKCPLNCRHCYSWVKSNDKKELPLDDLVEIISSFQERGLGNVVFLGGEPMTRFEDLLDIISSVKPVSETWISTSGFGLGDGHAEALKKAGLTGVEISLDHHEPQQHNDFRGNPDAYDWAMIATNNCSNAGLMTCWSFCVTREVASFENLMKYAELAASHKVNFIQLFEPMASGRFKGKDIKLDNHATDILEEFYIKMNTSRKYRHFPIVVYPGYHQRKMGCLAAGNRYLYIDTDGSMHPCPFCRSSRKIDIFSDNIETLIQELHQESCLIESAERLS